MFANTTLGGMNVCFPDVCNTLVGTAVSSISYSNIFKGTMSNPATATVNVLMEGALTIHQASMVTLGESAGI